MTSLFSPNSTLSPTSSPSELHCPLLQTMNSHTLNKDTGVIMAQYKTEIVELVEVYLAACRDNVRLPELCIEPDYLKFGDSLRGAGGGSWTQSMGHRKDEEERFIVPLFTQLSHPHQRHSQPAWCTGPHRPLWL